MKRNSLRTRVTTFYVGMLALALVVFSCSVYLGVRSFLTRSLERNVTTVADSIIADYVKPLNSKGETWFVSEMSESYPQGVSETSVRVSTGKDVLYQSGDTWDTPASTTSPLTPDPGVVDGVERRHLSNGRDVFVYTVSYKSDSEVVYLVETAASAASMQHVLRILFFLLLGTTPLILIVAAVGGYVLMSRPLRPVVTLTEQAERVGRTDLGERLPVIATGDELERLSLALNRMIERLEETVEHNRRFSADASHELRTPLTIIRGELELLLETPGLALSIVEGAASALDESKRMSDIVESLMTISRLEGGGERMDLAPVDLVSVTRSTVENVKLLAEEKSITLNFAGMNSVVVAGDVMRLKQIIVNLVDNAIKYTSENGTVRVAVSASGSMAQLVVSDTGIGVAPNVLPLIFDRFYRADQARSRVSGGVGLGLAIVKSICIAHHGTISAESVEGQGTTFRVEIPLLPGSIPEAGGGEIRSQSPLPATALASHDA
jgi:heavy metal sensor kinase